ncbi:MAG TPA: peptidylprolyl isomerase [Polyangia bacterium]|nr:peptidylprolyl isomerase [Polyangia bacterium]
MRPFHFCLCLTLTLTFGCHNRSPGDGAAVLARVGDSVITARDLEAQVAFFGHSKYLMDHYSKPEKKKEVLNGLIQAEALYQEACRLGYDRDPAVKRDVVNRMLMKEVDSQVNVQSVSDGDVEQYYLAHPKEFSRLDQVRFTQIVVKDRSKALRVAAEAKALPKGNTAALRALVSQDSEDEASRARGGDSGLIERNASSVPKAVVEAAFALAQINDVSDPIQTESGYTIVVLTQKQPGLSRSLAEAKSDIQSRLTYDGRQQRRNALIADVRKRARIQIDEAQVAKLTLPLPSSGPSTAAPDKRSPAPGPGAPPPAPATPGH